MECEVLQKDIFLGGKFFRIGVILVASEAGWRGKLMQDVLSLRASIVLHVWQWLSR